MSAAEGDRAHPLGKGWIAELRRLVLAPAMIFIAVMVLWERKAFHALLNIETFQLPIPSQIIDAFGRRRHDLWVGTWYTLSEAIAGLGLGATLGFFGAALFIRFDSVRRGLMPIAVSLN